VVIIHSGNYEYVCIRHRETQTLYVSDILHVPFLGNPGYGKLQVGIYLTAIDDALGRNRLEKAQAANDESPGDNDDLGPGPSDGGSGDHADDDDDADEPKRKRRKGSNAKRKNSRSQRRGDKDVSVHNYCCVHKHAHYKIAVGNTPSYKSRCAHGSRRLRRVRLHSPCCI
jgi:hypothetical protein